MIAQCELTGASNAINGVIYCEASLTMRMVLWYSSLSNSIYNVFQQVLYFLQRLFSLSIPNFLGSK